MREGLQRFANSTDNPFAGVENVEDLPMAVADELIAARIDASPYAAAKRAAVGAHATQIPESSWLNTLADGGFLGVEFFQLVRGSNEGLESDLFAGLDRSAA
jgi:N-acetyl-1-D-myo-inositol-2-amino-2-deoxy-alpha-D-glucopyranoside deacetylase